MRSAKIILFIFLPLMAVLFVQVEKNRLHKIRVSSCQSSDGTDLGVDPDDDSVSFPIDDDNLEDSPESTLRYISAVLVSFGTDFYFHDRQCCAFIPFLDSNAPRKNSLSFLKVFRI